jgi:hypothetical protein
MAFICPICDRKRSVGMIACTNFKFDFRGEFNGRKNIKFSVDNRIISDSSNWSYKMGKTVLIAITKSIKMCYN